MTPHQLRSLGRMAQAENPWKSHFGQLRGGILADDPGLGKTVTMLALIVRYAGMLPITPPEFWGGGGRAGGGEGEEKGWEELRRNPMGHRQLLSVLNPIRREFYTPPLPSQACAARFEAALTPLEEFANLGARSEAEMPSIQTFERAVDACVRAGMGESSGGMSEWSPSRRKRMREPARMALNVVRAGLDKRRRALHMSEGGRRALFERGLIPSGATLVLVPSALLEHWFEQIRRHVDLRVLGRGAAGGRARSWDEEGEMRGEGDGKGERRGEGMGEGEDEGWREREREEEGGVWVDGMGDMAGRADFRVRARDLGRPLPDEYVLLDYSIVLTTYERCAAEGRRGETSPLMKIRWLRLVVDEGHEMGSHEISTANRFIAALPAERRWVMSGTPTVGDKVIGGGGAIAQIGRLLSFLREPTYGVAMGEALCGGGEGGEQEGDKESRQRTRWQREVVRPMEKREEAVVDRLVSLLKTFMVKPTSSSPAPPARRIDVCIQCED
ncbi:MAG: hypothetical protein SGPRY_002909 [Prymnesium sp.]